MKTGQIITIVAGILTITAIYFGFIHEYQDRLTGWGKIMGKKMTREDANKILPAAPASYDDDFVIAWATAKQQGKTQFTIDGKKYYSTKTGKAYPIK